MLFVTPSSPPLRLSIICSFPRFDIVIPLRWMCLITFVAIVVRIFRQDCMSLSTSFPFPSVSALFFLIFGHAGHGDRLVVLVHSICRLSFLSVSLKPLSHAIVFPFSSCQKGIRRAEMDRRRSRTIVWVILESSLALWI